MIQANIHCSELRKQRTCLSILLSISLLGGCGGTGQDEGSPSNFIQYYSGLAIDGYLARATVFIDSNNNGTRDPWEAFAFTDNDGYYSYNPITDTNYCADNANAQEQQYCLVSNIQYSNVVIRIDAGYDITTGEPFLGQMSRRVNAKNQSEVTDSLISPITSLLSNVTDEEDQATLLTSLGINKDDLDVDYLNIDSDNRIDSSLLNTALKIHKVVAVLSDRLTDTYTEIGEDFGTPNDASSSIYPGLAEQIINSNHSLSQALIDPSVIINTLDTAESALRAVYERKEFDLPTDLGSISNPENLTRIVELATNIPIVVDSIIDINDTTLNVNDAIGGARAIETLVIKMTGETTNNNTTNIDPTIDNAIDFFTSDDTSQQELVDILLANLSMDSADISLLSINDFSGDDFDSADDIVDASTLDENIEAFSNIAGKSLRVSELDLGSAPDNLKDSEIEFYFLGNTDDIDGSFDACIKFIDEAHEDGSLGEGNTRGELISGFWSLLGANSENAESFSLLITITFLGTTYQAILKPAGQETIEDITYTLIRFDSDGELSTWHSEKSFTQHDEIPQSNEQCQEALPSRVGI